VRKAVQTSYLRIEERELVAGDAARLRHSGALPEGLLARLTACKLSRSLGEGT
jgi:hypothetical protein